MYSYPKDTAMTVMSNPKKASNFLRPYLSRPKKVNVSATVIKTPPHSGTVLLESKYMAIAVPITS